MTRYFYDFNGLFLYPYECQIDPLESKIQGKPVYMIPPNSTDIKPPEINDNDTLRFVDGAWVIEEQHDIYVDPEEPVDDRQAVEQEITDLMLADMEQGQFATALQLQLMEVTGQHG